MRFLVLTGLSAGAVVLMIGGVLLLSAVRSPASQESPTALVVSDTTPSATSTPDDATVSRSLDQLVDTATGRAVPLWSASESGGSVHFSADGRLLMYSKWFGDPAVARPVVDIIDLALDAPQPQSLTQGLGPQMSPDGRVVAFSTRSPDRVWVFDRTTSSTRSLEPPGQLQLWSPDSRWLTYWSPFAEPPEDRTLYLVDARDWSVRTVGKAYLCQCDAPYGPFWSPDSRWFYYPYSSDRQPALIDPASLARTPVAGYPYWAPTGTRFITLDQQSMTLHSGPSDAGVPLVEGQRGVHRPLWSPDETMISYEGANAGITALSLATARPLWQAPGFSIGWSAGSEYFAAAEKGGRIEGSRLNIVRGADGGPMNSLENVLNPAWSPKEPVLALARGYMSACNRPDNLMKLSLHLFDARTGEERLLLQGLESICRGSRPVIVWSPDGRYLALCSSCGGL